MFCIVLIQPQTLPVKNRLAWRGGADESQSPGDRLPNETQNAAPWRSGILKQMFAALCGAAFLAGCATEQAQVSYKAKPKSKEYFSERDYGVKASPRAIAAAIGLPGVHAKRMPRGGGREQVGKPYKIRGKWYYPKEDFGYDKSGTASWYGAAFHGRRTANGEIYDMNSLSAAHPTMPLPSYARVTNLANGNTVIVRVNDRGPYAHSRLIDMSKRAAEMLDYTSTGTAQVRVQYVGRAPVQGNDDQYLMASFQKGGGAAPQDSMQPSVMVAMAEPTPDLPGVDTAPAFASEAPGAAAAAAQDPFALMQSLDVPDIGPIVPNKPAAVSPTVTPVATNETGTRAHKELLAYADERIDAAYSAGEPFKALGLTETRIKALWKRGNSGSPAVTGEYILLGSFSQVKAHELQALLKSFGKLDADVDGQTLTLSLYANGAMPLDQMLEQSWSSGADDAFVVRP